MENYVEIKRTIFKESIKEIAEIFDANKIEFIVEDTKPSFDITFTNSGIVEYIVKVKKNDFYNASKILEINIEENLEIKGHYFDSYTDDELIEVISMPKEWSKLDLEYAKKLIKKRGIVVDEVKLEKAKLKQENDLLEPVEAKVAIILAGYLFSIVGSGIGILIAIHLKLKKKEIEGNDGILFYNEKSRKHGDIMLIISIICLIIWAIYFSI